MKLYYVCGSPNCRKVHSVINHLQVDIDFEYLDFFDGDLNSSEFHQVNPNRMVPVLEDGDFHLWESNAIIQYLADAVPGNTLFPHEAKARADVVHWQCWELAHYNNAIGRIAFELMIKPNFFQLETDHAVAEYFLGELQRFAPVLEGHLQGRDYLVGGGITLADYAVAHTEMFVDGIGFDWSPYPNIQAYYDRMRKNPHWNSTAVSDERMGRRPEAA